MESTDNHHAYTQPKSFEEVEGVNGNSQRTIVKKKTKKIHMSKMDDGRKQ